jgi:hypothetical protein
VGGLMIFSHTKLEAQAIMSDLMDYMFRTKREKSGNSVSNTAMASLDA